jgi:hypothetical protein
MQQSPKLVRLASTWKAKDVLITKNSVPYQMVDDRKYGREMFGEVVMS